MARQLRTEFPGALYHVYSRGNDKKSIFQDDADRYKFLSILNKVIKQYSYLCYGYCIMGTHYHLILETPDGNISRGMHLLHSTYAQYFNMMHDCVGHVFQGRFHSILVQREQRYASRPTLSELFEYSECFTKEFRNKVIFQAHSAYAYRQVDIARQIKLHKITINNIIKAKRSKHAIEHSSLTPNANNVNF